MKTNGLLNDGSRRRRSREEIRGVMREYAESGLSLLAFARGHGLCYATLCRWRAALAAETAASPNSVVVAEPKIRNTPGFVPIQVEDSKSNAEYRLSWPSGRSLGIPASFDPKRLRQLLEVLEGTR